MYKTTIKLDAMVDNFYVIEMLVFFLLASEIHLSNGLVQPLLGTFNFRQNCTVQHLNSKYKASCDGSKHFNTKDLFIDSRSVSRIAEIEFYSFESINIISKTSSDWEHIEKITIRNCNKVALNFQSNIRLNILKIDSVDELTFETDQAEYSIETKSILLTNVGKLNMAYSSKAVVKASNLVFNNVKDMSFYGKLQFSGELLTISQSNIDLTKLTTLFLRFFSISVKESTRMYFEESSQLDVSTYNFLIQESYIYMFGKVNLSGYEKNSGHKKMIKILNSSVYGMKKGHIHIDSDVNKIDFIENGIYQSDISDILVMIVETEGVTFTNNHFGCNHCTKRQFLQAKYLQLIGEQNFCDSTCNLTLTTYKELLDQGQICSRSESQVDDKTLCSSRSEPKHTESAPEYFLWIPVIVIIISLVFLLMLSYFYCKRHSPRFRSMPVQNNKVPEALKLESIQENPKVTSRAFSNEVYERVNSDSGNIYEIVDSPTESR